MVFGDDMGCYDKLPLRVLVEIANEDILIGRPRRTSYKHLMAFGKLLDNRQLLRLLLNLEHTVEAGVTRYRDIRDANFGQQLAADLVLHKEMGEAVEHTAILAAIPLEEHLVGTEDTADAIDRHVPVLQNVQVVIPELVLDEERHHGTDSPQEAAGIGNRVER